MTQNEIINRLYTLFKEYKELENFTEYLKCHKRYANLIDLASHINNEADFHSLVRSLELWKSRILESKVI